MVGSSWGWAFFCRAPLVLGMGHMISDPSDLSPFSCPCAGLTHGLDARVCTGGGCLHLDSLGRGCLDWREGSPGPRRPQRIQDAGQRLPVRTGVPTTSQAGSDCGDVGDFHQHSLRYQRGAVHSPHDRGHVGQQRWKEGLLPSLVKKGGGSSVTSLVEWEQRKGTREE